MRRFLVQSSIMVKLLRAAPTARPRTRNETMMEAAVACACPGGSRFGANIMHVEPM